uniref:Uncharacterized protein n=1 Tax=Anguilla anguilla TaxID=7936 RepID=A0A0E9QQC8_ANGAN
MSSLAVVAMFNLSVRISVPSSYPSIINCCSVAQK